MKTLLLFPMASFLLISLNTAAQPSIGGYNVYYGHLHNHCGISDGVQTPDYAYNYAKTTGDLDFFSLSDHSAAITADEWTAMKTAADKYNEAGIFTAFAGFEWTENNLGHVAVINSTNYITTASPYNTFSGLCNWLNSNECVAFFNHPGRNNSTGAEFSHFTTTPTDKIVGMELWNKTDRFNVYYYTDGYYSGDGNLGWYDEALTRGWNIGASGSEDNHSGTWGTMTPSKLAVLASANNRSEIMNALKAKRFFTTYDKNLGLSFKINGSEMGSTVAGGSCNFEIQASDADNELFTQIQLLKNGIVTNTWALNISNPAILLTLNCFDGEYYYIRVKQADNDEAVSSPIHISGGTVNLPPMVSVTTPAGGTILTTPTSVTINSTASDPDGSIAKVEFYQGTTLLGEDLTSPFSFTWTAVPAGNYSLTARATDNLGSFTLSSAVSVTVINPGDQITRSAIIATGMDDVEENATGTMYTTSTDIELVNDAGTGAGDQTVGLRFGGLAVPGDAIISNAYLQFTCDEVNTAACNLTIRGEASGNSSAFSAVLKDVFNRLKTSAYVNWVPPGWSIAGESGTNQRSPNLASVIQEIINLSGYTASGYFNLIITGTGSRVAEAYEGAPASAAKLVVEFKLPSVNLPPVVSITSPATGSSFTEPATVEIIASASDPDGTIAKVEFFQGTTLLGEDVTSPYSYTMTGLTAGTYSLTAKATDNTGASTVSGAIAITVTTAVPVSYTFTKRIIAGSDDAEEYSSGTMTLNSSALELVYATKSTGNQIVGLRFTGVTIPKGATVTKAYIQFGSSKKVTGTCNLTIKGENTGTSASFSTAKNNITNRVRTVAAVAWAPASWTTIGATGAAQQTPDLKSIVQEIILNAAWTSGNNMAFIINGTGTRTAYAFEGSSSKAALLYVAYTYAGGKSGMIIADQSSDPQIDENQVIENNIICYPVPFSDELHIGITAAKDENMQSIRLLNTNGEVVRDLVPQISEATIDAVDLPNGIYIVQVKTNLSVYRKSLLKIR